MRYTRIALRTPLIKFLGKNRNYGAIDHTPKAHPESPDGQLPKSFASYRANATTYGPLGTKGSSASSADRKVVVNEGEFSLRRELPERFKYLVLSDSEIENINGGGAEVIF